jgi:hypothetical protein
MYNVGGARLSEVTFSHISRKLPETFMFQRRPPTDAETRERLAAQHLVMAQVAAKSLGDSGRHTASMVGRFLHSAHVGSQAVTAQNSKERPSTKKDD